MIDLIISGGQTGADQGGIKTAKREGYATGGWAPKGWKTDAGAAPWLADYGLRESPYATYRIRTSQNVRMAHALIWIGNTESPGGILTLRLAKTRDLPECRIAYPYPPYDPVERCRKFIWTLPPDIRVLMIAGNRERMNVGIEAFTERVVGEGLIPF